MKKSNFKLLIDRYTSGKVSDYERKKIEAWLNVMKAGRITDLELDHATEERLLKKITNPEDTVDDVIALYSGQSKLKLLFSKPWIQVAAAVIILLSVSFTLWTLADRPDHERVLATGEKEKMILNDGTLVWLEPGSKLTFYQADDGSRRAGFTGEALFEVAKIPNSPFTITCGDIAVKVLGTSFSLKAEQGSVELKVLTGNVNLSSVNDPGGINAAPNEKVVYRVNGETARVNLDNQDVATLIANTEYDMQFDNSTMDRVIERLEKKFRVTVAVGNKELLQCHITVDLTDNSLEKTMAMLTDLLDLTYHIDGNAVSLNGHGCR